MKIITCSHCGAKNRVDEQQSDLLPVCGRCHEKLQANKPASVSDKPMSINDSQFESEVLGVDSVPVLVDCWAQWCPPCRALSPTIDQLASGAQGRWKVTKMNVDESPATARRFRIDSIPTLLIFREGRLVDRIVGLQSKAVIEARLVSCADR